MAKNPNKKAVRKDEPMNGAMKFFLAGCVAELYLLILRRFYVNADSDVARFAWYDHYLWLLGGIGAGVAVAGAFSLVRFRSAPGTAREIGVLFLGMAIGLATGMGYVGLAALTFVIVSAALLTLTALHFGQRDSGERILKITIPENLDYEGLFDDLFDQYTRAHTLVKVKTSNMGTPYELEYRVTLRSDSVPKAFLDALRCRNGNLNIVCGREMVKDAL